MSRSSTGEDDTRARGKYGLIAVPAFARDPGDGEVMTTSLRMGAASSTWEADPGGDLARAAHDMGFSSEGAHLRGGLFDHTSGDRLSTTRGDKIDVVTGHYKVHIARGPSDPSAAPLEISTHKLGVIEEEHTRGERYQTFDGARYERILGRPSRSALKASYGTFSKPVSSNATAERGGPSTGGASGGGGAGDDNVTIENTHTLVVVEETFAHEVSSITAASASITSVTNAPIMVRQSAAAVYFEEGAYAAKHSETQAGVILDNVICPGVKLAQTHTTALQSVTAAGAILEASIVTGALSSETLAGFVRDSVQGALVETAVGPQLTLNVGDEVAIAAGSVTELVLQPKLSVVLGSVIDAAIGLSVNISGPGSASVTFGTKVDAVCGIQSSFIAGSSSTYETSTASEISVSGTGLGAKIGTYASAIFLGK